MWNSNVSWANFRAATPDEISVKNGEKSNAITQYFNALMGVWGGYITSKPDSLSWHSPFPLRWIYGIQTMLGVAPERKFLTDIPTRTVTWHRIQDQSKVLEAFFKQHRNSEIFESSGFVKKLFGIIKEIFPDSNLSEDDFIFTTTPEKSNILHSLLLNSSLRQLRDNENYIKIKAKEIIQSWEEKCEKGKEINITKQTRLFASQVMCQLLLGNEVTTPKLCSSINFINYFIMRMSCGKVTQEDQLKYKEALKEFKEAVEYVLNCGKQIPIFENSEHQISENQKKIMIFTIFFAGQENLSSLLTYCIWQLAKDDNLHTQLFKDFCLSNEISINKFFNKCIKEFPPAQAVTRRLKADVVLEFKLQGDLNTHAFYMKKGNLCVGRIIDVAENSSFDFQDYRKWFPFGGGPHHCPGEILAVNCIKIFLKYLIENYNLDTYQSYDIPKLGVFTLQLEEDIKITLQNRRNEIVYVFT